MKKIFVITYQPKEKSDKAEYVETYIQEAKKHGNEIRIVNIHDLNIEYLKIEGKSPDLILSKELKEAQDNILWADQIVLVYPVWCMGLPAKLKAFIERVFQENVLVGYGKMGPEPIVKNKTMVIIQSYAMPYFFMKYFYGDLPYKMLKVIFSNWCGFKIAKRFDFDVIENVSEKKRQKWLKKIRKFVAKTSA